MSDVVIVAIITGLCSVIGQWLISRTQAEKRKIEDAVRDARLDDRLSGVEKRLDGVEKRLDEHNHYAQHFSEIKTDIAVIKNEIKNMKEI